jgi:hypothetical protein
LLICQLSAVAAVPATDRGERIGRPGCPGYCLGGASLDQARPASAMTRLPTRLWATRNRNYVQPLQYSAGRTNRTIMSSSSNTNIAKKARTKSTPISRKAAGSCCKSLRRATQRPSGAQSTSSAWHPAPTTACSANSLQCLSVRTAYLAHVSAVDDAGGIEFAPDCPRARVQDHDGYTSARVSSRRLDLPSSTTPID